MMIHIVNSALQIRLDRYLKRLFPQITQGIIEQLLRHRKIKVNDKKAESSMRLTVGDKILIPEHLQVFETQRQNSTVFAPTAIKLAEKIMNEYLIFENEYIIAINKPAKLATQGGTKINLSINDALSFLNTKYNLSLKLVHRLDKETSGVLLIAKSHLSANKLAEAFKSKTLNKKYIAVVAASPVKKHGQISSLLAKTREGSFEIMGECKTNGKSAVTLYTVLKKSDNLSLIEFTPLTGRTHQLRVHARALQCPIIGDRKYDNDLDALKSEYMLLHASSIRLPKEIFGSKIKIEAPIPSYFQQFITL